ncbi:MAG: hypothetical protein WCI49_09005 [Ferruginibacter sp.]
MGDTKKNQTRRGFLSIFLPADKTSAKPEMVKMLTADGKLVEVEKSVYDAVSTKQKVSNKEILNWMDNPSKENS